MKILLTEQQYKIIEKQLKEQDYSLHYLRPSSTNDVVDFLNNPEPYGGGTDNIYNMKGRGTGHFGSGVYLSSMADDRPEKLKDFLNNNPTSNDQPIIKASIGSYIINLDRYNLYKPKNENHARFLYGTLKLVNNIFYYYCSEHHLTPDLKNMIIELYEKTKLLNLEIPHNFFKRMTEFCSYDKNKLSSKASISTRFMEENGWNGVNVNNIPNFDTTEHGSVIYDINKTIDIPITTKSMGSEFEYNMNSWNKLLKIANNCFHCINMKNLTISQINTLIKSLENIIDLSSLYHMKQYDDDKISDEQFNHILKIYPKIAKQKIKENPNLTIPNKTLFFLMKNGYYPKPTSDTFYSLYKEVDSFFGDRTEKLNITKNYLNSINYDNLNDDEKMYYQDLIDEIKRMKL